LREIFARGNNAEIFAHDFLQFLREKMHEILREKNGDLKKILAAISETEIAV